MIQEIYIGIPNTNQYREKTIEITDDIGTILQRIRMVLGTRKGVVLGDTDFGMNIEDYLFDMNFSEEKIRKEILYQIAKYVSPTIGPMYSIDVKVNFGKNVVEGYDYMVIDIYINQQKLLGFLVNA